MNKIEKIHINMNNKTECYVKYKDYKKMKQSYEDKLKNVIKTKNKNYKIGDIVKYNGYEWYIIKLINNKATLLMKDCLTEDKMKELFAKKYLDDDNDVVFNLDESNNNWVDSPIRERLNNTLIEEFNKEELNLMRTNYDEDKYSEDYIRLVTIREIERLNEKIRKSSRINWTMSPYRFYACRAYASVWYVGSTGSLDAHWTTNARGVRPVINVNVEYLVEKVD